MLLLETFSSSTDQYGNRYHFARITNSRKDSVAIHIDAPCNLKSEAFDAFGGWEGFDKACFFVEHGDMPKREHRSRSKGAIYLDHEHTIKLLKLCKSSRKRTPTEIAEQLSKQCEAARVKRIKAMQARQAS